MSEVLSRVYEDPKTGRLYTGALLDFYDAMRSAFGGIHTVLDLFIDVVEVSPIATRLSRLTPQEALEEARALLLGHLEPKGNYDTAMRNAVGRFASIERASRERRLTTADFG